FLALFEVDGWADKQDAHFFIDDPVSSLDDHNIFITADSIVDLIEKNYLKKRIIITTHHIGLYSILFDRLRKGEKSGRYKDLTKLFILTTNGDKFELKPHTKDVFLFHLHLMQTLDEAISKKLYLFHFVLLRQLLENISSFIGSGRVGFILSEINVDKPNDVLEIINSLSHQNVYRFQFNEMSPEQETLFNEVYKKIQEKYKFRY
ncbi:MAG TPA: AAA family ATPase, partial [Pyrinomonadaceae bacterium]